MAGGLRVNPDQIQESAVGIRQTAQNLASSVQDFQGQVQGLIQPPGGDMISPLIWSAHHAVLSSALRCFASNTSALSDQAAKLDLTAETYRQAEQDNVTAINQIRGSL
jgi:hypothetical protein